MHVRNAALLALAVLLALFAWSWSTRAPSAASGESAPPVQLLGDAHAGASKLVQHHADAREPEISPVVSDAPAPPDRPIVPSSGPEELRIVIDPTREPAVGARVWWTELDERAESEWFPSRLDVDEGVRRLEREGRLHQSDERGLVRLPTPRARIVALARLGERFGLGWFDAEAPRPWTLELFASGDWVVRVRDVRGEPIAGLPMEWTGGLSARRTTDEQGIARLRNARWVLARADGDHFAVKPYAVLRETPIVRWKGRMAPPTPTEFTLPELGKVEVLLRDPDGAPWVQQSGASEDVSLREARTNAADTETDVGFVRLGPDEPYRIHAQIGLELEAAATAFAVAEQARAVGAGPIRPHESVQIELVLGTSFPIARMRVFGPEGDALRDAVIHVGWNIHHRGGHERAWDRPRTTSLDAELLLPLKRYPSGASAAVLLSLPERPGCRARVELPREVGVGWLDLGDVRLTQAPLIAAGRVVDARGLPVAGARVSVMSVFAMDESLDTRSRAERELAPTLPGGGFGIGVEADESGFFEQRSHELLHSVRVQLADDYADHAVLEGPPGKDDFLLVKPDPSAFGRVLLPKGVRGDEFERRLEHVNGDSSHAQLDVDGGWSVKGLEAGAWRFGIHHRSGSSEEPLASASFEARDGVTVRAPDVDLSALRVIELRVTDALGEPLDCSVEYAPPGAEESFEIQVQRGRAHLVTQHARVDAIFETEGRLRVRVEDIQDGAHVVLERGHAVRVRLLDPSVLPPPPYELVAWIDGGGSETFGQASEIELLAMEAGEHSVHVAVRDRRRAWDPKRRVVLESLPAIRLPIGANAAPLELSLTPERVQAAVRGLEAR